MSILLSDRTSVSVLPSDRTIVSILLSDRMSVSILPSDRTIVSILPSDRSMILGNLSNYECVSVSSEGPFFVIYVSKQQFC